MKNSTLLTLVKVIHWIIILLNIFVPFMDNPYLLQLYVICVPFMWLHWMTNDDTCALTLMESRLRGVSSNETFLHEIISPIYKFQGRRMENSTWWIISYILWSVAMLRLFGGRYALGSKG